MVAFGELVWAVSNASTPGADFEAQVFETLQRLDQSLREAGSDRGRLLSVQVILADVSMRGAFDALWQAWIGPDPLHWPQRAVHGAALAPGLWQEVVATAARTVDADA